MNTLRLHQPLQSVMGLVEITSIDGGGRLVEALSLPVIERNGFTRLGRCRNQALGNGSNQILDAIFLRGAGQHTHRSLLARTDHKIGFVVND